MRTFDAGSAIGIASSRGNSERSLTKRVVVCGGGALSGDDGSRRVTPRPSKGEDGDSADGDLQRVDLRLGVVGFQLEHHGSRNLFLSQRRGRHFGRDELEPQARFRRDGMAGAVGEGAVVFDRWSKVVVGRRSRSEPMIAVPRALPRFGAVPCSAPVSLVFSGPRNFSAHPRRGLQPPVTGGA